MDDPLDESRWTLVFCDYCLLGCLHHHRCVYWIGSGGRFVRRFLHKRDKDLYSIDYYKRHGCELDGEFTLEQLKRLDFVTEDILKWFNP